MQVKTVAITKSLVEEVEMTAEELMIYIARVSNPSNQLNTGTSDKLVNYLQRKKHFSPFEHASMTVEIITSRAIAAQILRHRSFAFQEFSQRYAEVVDIEPVQLRKQATVNRQSSSEDFDPIIAVGDSGSVLASELVKDTIEVCVAAYKELIKAGVAKEVARMILPATAQTKIYKTGSVRSWLTYLNVRLEEGTQKEHRDIAIRIGEELKKHFPMVATAFADFNDFKGNFIA